MNSFKLLILAADKPFFDGDCISLVVPTSDGLYGIQAQHSNMIAAIPTGEMKFTTPNGAEHLAAVSDGMVKVENNNVLILVDTAERPEEIDENKVKKSLAQAKEAILQKKSTQDYYAAQAKMARAINRLRVKNRNHIT